MKIEDIAVAMGKSPGAVKLLIHRGVSRLREDAGRLEAGRMSMHHDPELDDVLQDDELRRIGRSAERRRAGRSRRSTTRSAPGCAASSCSRHGTWARAGTSLVAARCSRRPGWRGPARPPGWC